jgi:hypothetical protein
MTNLLQEQIEDYVAGTMPDTDKIGFEQKIKVDEELRQKITETQRLREILLRSRVHRKVNAARTEINQPPKRGIIYVFGSFAAAASIIFFLLSIPITFSTQESNYRGEIEPINQGTQARENDFRKAQAIIKKGNEPKKAIKLLEQLAVNPDISQNYQRNSKWLLVIALLQADEAIKAENIFNEINCEGIECPYSSWEKTKIKWQIFWKKL